MFSNIKVALKNNYFEFALIGLVAGFFILPTSKMLNNYYYALFALPALGYGITKGWRNISLNVITSLWLIWLALFFIAAWGEWNFYKHIIYVLLFFIPVFFWVKQEITNSSLFARGMYWLVIAYVLFYSCIIWLISDIQFGERIVYFLGRITSPIFLSMVLVCFFVLSLSSWLNEKRYKELAAALVSLFFVFIFILQSRSGYVGFMIIVSLYIASLFVQKFGFKKAFVVFWVLLLVVTGLAFILYQSGHLYSLTERSDAGRFQLWLILLDEYSRCNWAIGCGPSFMTEQTLPGGVSIDHAHSIFVTLLVKTGAFALATFLLAAVFTLYIAIKTKNKWGWFLLAALIMLNFDGSQLIGSPDEMWLLILLPIGLIAGKYTQLQRLKK